MRGEKKERFFNLGYKLIEIWGKGLDRMDNREYRRVFKVVEHTIIREKNEKLPSMKAFIEGVKRIKKEKES